MRRCHRFFRVGVSSALLAACAGTTTQLAPVAPKEVAEEEMAQRRHVLLEIEKAQRRLDDLGFPLLVSAAPLCEKRSAARLGFSVANVRLYENRWAEAASSALGLSDTLSVRTVAVGSPAAAAGLQPGDLVVGINGDPAPIGKGAVGTATKLFSPQPTAPLKLTMRRRGEALEAVLHPVVACKFEMLVVAEGDINAYADGDRVIMPWAMMRFANDDELGGVLGHEIAHNAMGHIDARKKNAFLGALFGALLDVAAATQGTNTGGRNTANFMAAAARAFSQDFEREADYVGMYVLARAGRPLETVPLFWRHFAQINPRAISYASTHPTTAERFVRLRSAAAEIERKRAGGLELLPEMKKPN